MHKNHLRLVVNNQNKKETLFQKFYEWLNKPRCITFPALPFVPTYLEKKEFVQNYLTQKFAEYQLTTGEVGLFPLCEAINEVERLKKTIIKCLNNIFYSFSNIIVQIILY